jgi:hypothetical protein
MNLKATEQNCKGGVFGRIAVLWVEMGRKVYFEWKDMQSE